MASTPTLLSKALYREVRPEFFRILAGPAARLYLDALDALERVATQHVHGIDRDAVLGVIEQAVELHKDLRLDDDFGVNAVSARDKARAVLETFRRAGWVEEEERSDWQKLIHFQPSGQSLLQVIRRIAFPEALIFSDRLVTVCSTLTRTEDENDPLRTEPWQHVESCVLTLQEGIAELRGMQTAIERHTRRQLSALTLRENLTVLFDQFAERIGQACYAELVRARLPFRLSEARRRVDELGFHQSIMDAMQAEVQRRDPALSTERAQERVRERLEELSDLLQSVVPVADAVDRRTAEFTRRSLARFRYLQETTSENRAHVQEFFEILNRHFAGLKVNDLEDEGIEFPVLRIHDTRILAGLESLYTPRLRRLAGEIEPLAEEASAAEQDDAMRRLRAAMRDSLSVGRANRFVEELLPERGTSINSADIPMRCEDDVADVIAVLLHSSASNATYDVTVPRAEADADAGEHDTRLNYRIERFDLSRP